MELAIETYQRRVGVYKSSEKHGNFRIDIKDGWRRKKYWKYWSYFSVCSFWLFTECILHCFDDPAGATALKPLAERTQHVGIRGEKHKTSSGSLETQESCFTAGQQMLLMELSK